MKVLYDYQVFTWQRYGGISRYFTQIISNLPKDIKTEIAIKYSDNEYLKNTNIVPLLESHFTPYRVLDQMLFGLKFKGKKKFLNLFYNKSINQYIDSLELNRQYSIEKLQQQDFDIFHPTYYDPYFLDHIGKKPFVLTIHDMIHELYPEIVFDLQVVEAKAKLARKANHIIAISERTKQDIIEILKIPEKNISVIYHANSLIESGIETSLINIPNKFILFVGEREGYKNFLFMVESLAKILKDIPDLYVICTGKSFSEKEELFMKNFDVFEKFIALPVDDSDLSRLYKNASCLIFPSYYEGFGIPIVEAFNFGCPVLASKTDCFKEIANDAALFFDPKNINDIALLVSNILKNEDKKHELIQKSIQRNKIFSWDLSAQKTGCVYNNVLSV